VVTFEERVLEQLVEGVQVTVLLFYEWATAFHALPRSVKFIGAGYNGPIYPILGFPTDAVRANYCKSSVRCVLPFADMHKRPQNSMKMVLVVNIVSNAIFCSVFSFLLLGSNPTTITCPVKSYPSFASGCKRQL
jgi:hypothetical protein